MEFGRRFEIGFFVSTFVFTSIYSKSLSMSIQNINSTSVILCMLFTQADMNLSASKESFFFMKRCSKGLALKFVTGKKLLRHFLNKSTFFLCVITS